MPALVDPADPGNPQFAYGIHYPSLSVGISRWNRQFGRLSATVPVIVTEWDQNSTNDCLDNAPQMSTLLLDYLITKHIGIVGFAFDLPGTIVADYSFAPTSFDDFACGVPNGGPGELLFNEYAGLAQAGGPQHVIGDPAWIVNSKAVASLETLNPGVTKHFFNSPRAFVVGANANKLTQLAITSALPTAKFTNEATLAAAVNSGDLPPGTRAVMFADEYGALTPRAQQLHPSTYYSRAALVAHRAGLLLVAAPATSLVFARAPETPVGRANAAVS